MLSADEFHRRLGSIRLVVTDVDGVLTDGSIGYLGDDSELKVFNVHDGSAVYIARVIDVAVAVVTARTSDAVARRFAELPVFELRQGAFDKLRALHEIADAAGVELDQSAYLGDDLVDLAAIRAAGLGVTVADGAARLRQDADWVLTSRGGHGALRELIDAMVDARGLWDRVLADYLDRQSTPDGV